MRSGLQDPLGYEGLVDSGLTPVELLESLPDPTQSAGATISDVNMNYILLGMIIEHETGGPPGGRPRDRRIEQPTSLED